MRDVAITPLFTEGSKEMDKNKNKKPGAAKTAAAPARPAAGKPGVSAPKKK